MRLVYNLFANLRHLYWNRILGPPAALLEDLLGEEFAHPLVAPLFKGAVTLAFLLIVYETQQRIRHAIRTYRINKSMSGHDVREPHTVKNTDFVDELDAAQFPVHTLAQLKKEKRYGKLGDIHARLNQPAEAARWFLKDKQYQRAAEELAKAGETRKAARLLERVGDHATAARFYAGMGRHKDAAAACLKAGDWVGAARAYADANLPRKAADCFFRCFAATDLPKKYQEDAADACYQMLSHGVFADALDQRQRNTLFKETAQRFLAAGRAALAARVFQEAGETKLAGDVYKQISASRNPDGQTANANTRGSHATGTSAPPSTEKG